MILLKRVKAIKEWVRTMNRAAAGTGSWLLLQRTPQLSLDITAQLLEQTSYSAWLEDERNAGRAAEERAFLAVLDEIWQETLDEREQQVLYGIFWEGRTATAIGRTLGLHHSVVGRCRERALEKLRAGLRYVLRYRSLVDSNQE